MENSKKRCFGDGKDFYAHYHDHEWAVPVYDDRDLFELLCLEGAQAGLSWETVLKRREGYRELFKNFDPKKCATISDEELQSFLQNEKIIRNRLKVFSVRKNAQIFVAIQKEFGSFSNYLWAFVNHTPIINHPKTLNDILPKSEISDTISKDLRKRGMSFVGSTIIYAYMQAAGLVNDHLVSCPLKSKLFITL